MSRSGGLRKALGCAGPVCLLGGLAVWFLGPLVLTNRILAGLDIFTYIYPYRQYAAEALRAGRIPLWNPYLFMGAPFLANPQAGVLYPLNLLLTSLDAPEAVEMAILVHLTLAAAFAYAWARRGFGFGRAAALVMAMTFGVGGFLGAQAEHVNQLSTSAWLPLALLLVDLSLPGRSGGGQGHRCPWLGRAGLAGVLGVAFLAGHTQAWYICVAAVGLYALLPGLQRGTGDLPERVRLMGQGALLWLGAVAGALALAAAQLLPTLELMGLSIRAGGLAYREAVSFSLRPGRLLYSLLPTYAEDLGQVFASPAWTEWVGYVGVLGWLLALVAWGAAERRRALTVGLAFAAGGLFLALGGYNPFYFVLYHLVPGFRSFRAPARWLLWFALGMSVLAGAGVDALRPGLLGRLGDRFRGILGLGLDPARRAWRWAALVALAGAVALGLWLLDLPAASTWTGWGVAFAAGAAVVGVAGWRPGAARWARVLLVVLVAVELFTASRMLPTAWPTAREAFSSLRTAPAFLLTDDSLGRFLSLSGIRYDPGDLPEMRQIFAGPLPERAFYDYVVAAKEKEILAPNLPLLFRVPGVDGYDGGVLPLRRYVFFQRLFLPEEDILPDGRLREQLQEVPPTRLLSLAGVKYVITDKVQDVWVDGFYYDLEHTARLGGGVMQVAASDLPRFPTSALGVVSYLEGATAVPDGAPVAEVLAEDTEGMVQRWVLRAGIHTAEGRGGAAHRPARAVHAWREGSEGHDYLAVLPVEGMAVLTDLRIRSLLESNAVFCLRGVSLLNEPTQTSESLIFSTDGRFRLAHSGDVKVYQNQDYFSRVYLVHEVQVEPDDGEALRLLANPAFDPKREAVLANGRELTSAPEGADEVSVVRYAPEEVVISVSAAAPGYLVCSDAWYPGWQAEVDGQPATLERANVLFRAVYVPAGVHQVRMTFRPAAWAWGWRISLAAAGGLALVGVGGWWRGARRKWRGSV